jgi:hypothetical protein
MKRFLDINYSMMEKFSFYLHRRLFPMREFETSSRYWEDRYRTGGNSGYGSYGNLGEYKGAIINEFIKNIKIETVVEFGCGDGNQLKYFDFKSYLGYDVSKTAVKICKRLYRYDKTKTFRLLDCYVPFKADLTLSLDVIYHLIEIEVFHDHMRKLFDTTDRFVIIYSSNSDEHENNNKGDHVKHRNFTNWIKNERPNFELIKYIPNMYKYNGNGISSSYSDFYIFEKIIIEAST